MRKFFRKVVDHPKMIFAIYAAALIVCLCCVPFIEVNYDMNDYLPEDCDSTVALDVMEEEYGGGITNARVMVEDVTVAEALDYKEQLSSAEGVTEVTWLDDVVSLEEPLEVQDPDTVETYYKDNCALFLVTIDEDLEIEACEAIREIIGDDNALTGNIVATETSTVTTLSETMKVGIFGICFATAMLLLTTTSWLDAFFVMLNLILAVVLNAGSNLIFGEISFVTNAGGSVLQMAVSLDYSVFLLHRFEECRKEYSDPKEAMVEAMVRSAGSIFSSGFTTVISFLALCLMRFQIGPDLGLALAKGIAISLVSVFTLMPNIILCTRGAADKTHHRDIMPSFRRFGRLVQKMMIPLLVVFCILVVPCYMASNSNEYYYGSSHIFGPNTQLGAETERVEEIFGQSDTYVILVPKDSTAAEVELSDALHEVDEITSIVSYVDTVGAEIPEEYLDEGTLSQLNSENYTRMILTVDAEYEGEETFELVEEIRDIIGTYYEDDWYLAGEGVSTYDLMDTVTSDMIKVNLVAIIAVFLVLLFSMKSVTLPFLLLLVIESGIWINLAIPYLRGQGVFYIAYLIISSIQLGVTVDYAILFTNRYLEFRKTCGKKEAIVETISAVTVSIMTSASVLAVVGILMGAGSTHGLVSQLGYFLGIGAICSFILVFFVLPGLLWLFDGLIQRTTKGVQFANPDSKAVEGENENGKEENHEENGKNKV